LLPFDYCSAIISTIKVSKKKASHLQQQLSGVHTSLHSSGLFNFTSYLVIHFSGFLIGLGSLHNNSSIQYVLFIGKDLWCIVLLLILPYITGGNSYKHSSILIHSMPVGED
jgi:hypothetical protein